MLKFLKEALSENGVASIKRWTLETLKWSFLAECAIYLIWGKLLEPTLRDQLYYAFLGTLGTVFGVNILNGIKDIKMKQSDNNAAVGAASPPPPPPDTTIVK